MPTDDKRFVYFLYAYTYLPTELINIFVKLV